MKKLINFLLSFMILCFAVAAAAEETQKVSAGDIITFGHYEQDNNLENGPEAIEWIVLDVKDGKALLLSKYGLEAKPYNVKNVDITWENCTLRTWLNDDFLNAAFSAEEQSAIPVTKVDNSDSQGYDWSIEMGENTTGGNNTQDRIFLLSYAEANQYLDVKRDWSNKNIKSRVAPTEYAIQNGAWANDSAKARTEEDKPAGDWWLRSPGHYQNYAAAVLSNGMFHYGDVYVEIGTVRPALWMALNSGN